MDSIPYLQPSEETKLVHNTAQSAINLLYGHNSSLFHNLIDRISELRKAWVNEKISEAVFNAESFRIGSKAIEEIRKIWWSSPSIPDKVKTVCRTWYELEKNQINPPLKK